ncbi:MAG: class I SAM-dependent methyltransferase [Caulobacteraceae bacterium]|nr:class I SAM-dependent methyltransferase [Caulobacteraceae bacterium]
MKPIHLRNIPPPGETFNHVDFLDGLLQWIRPECYLELGVRDGRNFITVAKHCIKAIGVDIAGLSFELQQNMEYHSLSTNEYFKNLDLDIKFDAVFIDADHSHEQSLVDFINVKDRVIEDGFIFLHDTYPYDPVFFDKHACNDVYKTALYIKQNLIDEFEILTLPFNPGVTIVKKIKRNKQLCYINN